MNNITDITVSPLTKSSYLKPIKIKYSQNGVDKEQHLLKVHNSVAVLLFNTSRNVFVFVKQFRPAHEDNAEIETIKYPSEHGFTLELCAGILDQELPPEEIARLEVLEECGYVVPASNFKHIISLRNTALTGSKQAIFYAEVTDAMRTLGVTSPGPSAQPAAVTCTLHADWITRCPSGTSVSVKNHSQLKVSKIPTNHKQWHATGIFTGGLHVNSVKLETCVNVVAPLLHLW
ncbi:uridine diphosphate glucose pyrophosphatase NUDT14-like isoform X2 [Bacillus rossius redtenbacheri]|uniref:uridine diphosphate glucose pyrophosphatase NUDT14-like isoform X2 n=1 Tax=Bacillus rossius redtenbacheri TaxID=93214 RepID=UPI002FDC9BA6